LSKRKSELQAVDRHVSRRHSTGLKQDTLLSALNPLAERTFPHELLDEGSHPNEELYETFRDMRRVNRLLGGVAITLLGLDRLTGHRSKRVDLFSPARKRS
jgi:hypothetical protein